MILFMKKKTWERRILDAKKRHRPKLTEAHLRGTGGWEKDRFAYSQEEGTGGRAEDFESLQRLPSNAKGAIPILCDAIVGSTVTWLPMVQE